MSKSCTVKELIIDPKFSHKIMRRKKLGTTRKKVKLHVGDQFVFTTGGLGPSPGGTYICTAVIAAPAYKIIMEHYAEEGYESAIDFVRDITSFYDTVEAGETLYFHRFELVVE